MKMVHGIWCLCIDICKVNATSIHVEYISMIRVVCIEAFVHLLIPQPAKLSHANEEC